MPNEKSLYDSIATKCKINSLNAQEKKNLFINFIAEETKFLSIAEGTLKDLSLFLNEQGVVKPLCELIDSNLNTPPWVNPFKIKAEENFIELKKFLIPEKKIYKEI